MAPRRQVSVDAWPPRMNAETAAVYCGERHVEDFLQRVGEVYPEPKWVESSRRKFWYRGDLDRHLGLVDAPSGLGARFVESRQKRAS